MKICWWMCFWMFCWFKSRPIEDHNFCLVFWYLISLFFLIFLSHCQIVSFHWLYLGRFRLCVHFLFIYRCLHLPLAPKHKSLKDSWLAYLQRVRCGAKVVWCIWLALDFQRCHDWSSATFSPCRKMRAGEGCMTLRSTCFCPCSNCEAHGLYPRALDHFSFTEAFTQLLLPFASFLQCLNPSWIAGLS